MKKMLAVLLMATATTAFAEPDMSKYDRSCKICHAAGVANAPKTGDAEAWAPRLEKGMDALVASVEKGMNAMPPKGMCTDCSAEEFKALIEYMAKPAE